MGNCCGKRDDQFPKTRSKTQDNVYCVYYQMRLDNCMDKDQYMKSTKIESGNVFSSSISSNLFKNKLGSEQMNVKGKELNLDILGSCNSFDDDFLGQKKILGYKIDVICKKLNFLRAGAS